MLRRNAMQDVARGGHDLRNLLSAMTFVETS